MQIQFDKLTKEIGLFSGAIPPQVALESAHAARPTQPKVVAVKDIKPEIEPKKEDEQYEDILAEKDVNSGECFIATNGKSNLIECSLSIPTKAHILLKNFTEHADILTRNENGKAVVYVDAIPGSNFKSLLKSMVCNQQNLNQISINEFLRALRSLNVKKDNISGEPLKIKKSNVAPNSTHQRHSTPTKYEDEEEYDNEEDDNEEEVRPPSHKYEFI